MGSASMHVGCNGPLGLNTGHGMQGPTVLVPGPLDFEVPVKAAAAPPPQRQPTTTVIQPTEARVVLRRSGAELTQGLGVMKKESSGVIYCCLATDPSDESLHACKRSWGTKDRSASNHRNDALGGAPKNLSLATSVGIRTQAHHDHKSRSSAWEYTIGKPHIITVSFRVSQPKAVMDCLYTSGGSLTIKNCPAILPLANMVYDKLKLGFWGGLTHERALHDDEYKLLRRFIFLEKLNAGACSDAGACIMTFRIICWNQASAALAVQDQDAWQFEVEMPSLAVGVVTFQEVSKVHTKRTIGGYWCFAKEGKDPCFKSKAECQMSHMVQSPVAIEAKNLSSSLKK